MPQLNEISISDILGKDNVEGTGPSGIRSTILNYVRQNSEGVTVAMVAKHLDVSTQRAREVLNELVMKRDLYKRSISEKVILYYPNGKLIHKYLQESKDFGDQIYRISFHEGKKSPRIQIQERKFTLVEGERVEGSIFIDFNNVQKLRDFLDEMLLKYNTFKEV
jgi:hypothetical protein